MTDEEAVDILDDNFTVIDTHGHFSDEEVEEARQLAIKALQSKRNMTNEAMCQQLIHMEAENERLHDALERLEQQPCEDCISRKALHEALYEHFHDENAPNNITEVTLGSVRNFVKDFPPVTPTNSKIEYVEQKQFINKPCVSSGVCEHDKNDVLDKIRAEIDVARFIDKDTKLCKNANASGLEVAMQIIDKYKAESEVNE